MLNAAAFTPVAASLIPTGEIAKVAGGPMDFTAPTAIGARIRNDDQQLVFGKGYDHNFVLDKPQRGALSLAARVHEPTTGRVMEIQTTEPGIQFYSGNFLDASLVGTSGKSTGSPTGSAWRRSISRTPRITRTFRRRCSSQVRSTRPQPRTAS